MATSTSSRAKEPVSLMEVKERLIEPGYSGESAYIFALNFFMLPYRCLALRTIVGHALQKSAM